MKRELLEELNYEPETLHYFGKYSFKHNHKTHYGEMFLSSITEKLLKAEIAEGVGKAVLPIDQILENKDDEIGPVTTDFLVPIKEALVKLNLSNL